MESKHLPLSIETNSKGALFRLFTNNNDKFTVKLLGKKSAVLLSRVLLLGNSYI